MQLACKIWLQHILGLYLTSHKSDKAVVVIEGYYSNPPKGRNVASFPTFLCVCLSPKPVLETSEKVFLKGRDLWGETESGERMCDYWSKRVKGWVTRNGARKETVTQQLKAEVAGEKYQKTGKRYRLMERCRRRSVKAEMTEVAWSRWNREKWRGRNAAWVFLGTALFCALSQRVTREARSLPHKRAGASHASSEFIKTAPILHINYPPRACWLCSGPPPEIQFERISLWSSKNHFMRLFE